VQLFARRFLANTSHYFVFDDNIHRVFDWLAPDGPNQGKENICTSIGEQHQTPRGFDDVIRHLSFVMQTCSGVDDVHPDSSSSPNPSDLLQSLNVAKPDARASSSLIELTRGTRKLPVPPFGEFSRIVFSLSYHRSISFFVLYMICIMRKVTFGSSLSLFSVSSILLIPYFVLNPSLPPLDFLPFIIFFRPTNHDQD